MSNQATKPTKAATTSLPTLESLYGGNPEDALNSMGVDANLKQELQKKGFPFKFINFVKFKTNGNVNKGGWVPYKRESKADNAFGALFATDPDGYTVRGEMVLAVRDPQLHTYFKGKLAERNKAYQLKNVQQAHSRGTGLRVSNDDD